MGFLETHLPTLWRATLPLARPASGIRFCPGTLASFEDSFFPPSKEVRFLSKLVSTDPRSSTCSNLRYLSQMTGLNKPESLCSARIRMALPVKTVPDAEKWRLGLLASLKKLKTEKYHKVEDYQHICAMMDSLCST